MADISVRIWRNKRGVRTPFICVERKTNSRPPVSRYGTRIVDLRDGLFGTVLNNYGSCFSAVMDDDDVRHFGKSTPRRFRVVYRASPTLRPRPDLRFPTMNIIETRHVGEHGGFDIDAHISPDPDLDPKTNGDYSDEAIAAWRSGDWSYVTVTVTASKDGVNLSRASIGGCEYGWFPGVSQRVNPLDGAGDDFCNGYGPGLIDEAVAEAHEELSRLNV